MRPHERVPTLFTVSVLRVNDPWKQNGSFLRTCYEIFLFLQMVWTEAKPPHRQGRLGLHQNFLESQLGTMSWYLLMTLIRSNKCCDRQSIECVCVRVQVLLVKQLVCGCFGTAKIHYPHHRDHYHFIDTLKYINIIHSQILFIRLHFFSYFDLILCFYPSS